MNGECLIVNGRIIHNSQLTVHYSQLDNWFTFASELTAEFELSTVVRFVPLQKVEPLPFGLVGAVGLGEEIGRGVTQSRF